MLEDNLRVPSGIGYAMQNRRLTEARAARTAASRTACSPSSATPALLRRALLEAAAPGGRRRPAVVVLSQGPDDSAWFEHRMLAEEMGVPLVAQHRAAGRRRRRCTGCATASGTAVDVIYLRMGEDSLVHSPGADGMPLGPSLVAALHADTVALANALGNGIGDDKAVYAYVPRLIEYYLGEKPLLADVPTYLCGDPRAARRGAGPAGRAGLQAGRRVRRRPAS